MMTLLIFILKSLIISAILYGFYYLFMRRESYLVFNRYYLLTSVFLMVVLPFLGFAMPPDIFGLQAGEDIPVIRLPEVVIRATKLSPETEKYVFAGALLIYAAIAIATLAGLFRSLYRINQFIKLIRNGEKLNEKATLIAVESSPFSFRGRIYIPESYKNHPGLPSILIHEDAHIRQNHFADLILVELISCLFWFNPFFYLAKQSLREVHEFLADREVIRKGVKPIDYQQLLFNEVTGKPQYIVATNFNFITKKRIVMLLKKSIKPAAIRIGILFPLMVALIASVTLLSTGNAIAQENSSKNTQAVENTLQPKTNSSQDHSEPEVFTQVEVMPEFPGGFNALIDYVVQNLKYPPEARRRGIQGTVYVSFIVEKSGKVSNARIIKGIGGGCDEEALRVVNAMPKWTPGKNKGKPVKVQFNLPLKFALAEDKK